MNGLSSKLFGCHIYFALTIALLMSLAWTLPVENKETTVTFQDETTNTEEFIEGVPVIEESSNHGQLRFPPFNNNESGGFFERFGEKFRNKWNPSSTTTTTTTTTTTRAPAGK
ncbi:uncharacterized protein LOC123257262 [Drosophila ananassae]|uniref:uncharacterized protein LOC123257262 n=1 Tax=Drosophila ananassae TaxID=7217 RepID=UPI001CFF5D89|nr:uncharacterized protein LOC123257262 [Drosophila ananassae]